MNNGFKDQTIGLNKTDSKEVRSSISLSLKLLMVLAAISLIAASSGIAYYFAVFLPAQGKAIQEQTQAKEAQLEKQTQDQAEAEKQQEIATAQAKAAKQQQDQAKLDEQTKNDFVANTIQCKQFGASTNDYKTQSEPPDEFGLKGKYFDQEFVYSQNLNTCLVYYRYDDNFQNPPHPPIEVIFDLLHKKVLYRTFYSSADCTSVTQKCVTNDQFNKIKNELFN